MSSDFTLQLRCNHVIDDTSQPPAPRSAHNCVPGPNTSVYLTAGDSGLAGQRFSDTWQLCGSSGTYRWREVVSQGFNSDQQGQQARQGCTPRSNAAAVTVGDWLLLFGGWNNTGLEPLAALEAFNFNSSTWHMPAPAGPGPSPRGQPAAAADTAGTAMWLFGGWDGCSRFNDLHRLLLGGNHPNDWVWELVVPQEPPPKGARAGITFQQQQALQQQGITLHQHQQGVTNQQQQQKCEIQLPCERADHVMVCWHYCDDGVWKDLLVVFGGSSSQGLLNDTWLFDTNTTSWTQAFSGGAAAPCPRSSCAAAITGDVLLAHGGQTPAGVLHDLHLLNLSTLTWLQVDLGDILQPLCRHSMVVCDDACLVFGGYDGSSTTNCLLHIDLQPVMQLQRSSLQDLINSMACCGTICSSFTNSGCDTAKGGRRPKVDQLLASSDAAAAAAGDYVDDADPEVANRLKAVGVLLRASVLPVPPVVKVLSKKAAPPPLKLTDLPNADEVAAMPQWKQVRQLHQAALAAGCDQYIDPKTGYTVFTAKYLQQRPCCGNKCRHCPHGWANVAKQRLQPTAATAGSGHNNTASAAASMDW